MNQKQNKMIPFITSPENIKGLFYRKNLIQSQEYNSDSLLRALNLIGISENRLSLQLVFIYI